MLKLLTGYTSYDGHTAEIADQIATTLRDHDCAAEVCDLARSRPKQPADEHLAVMAGGPLPGGKHQLMIRIGRGPKMPGSVRRPMDDVSISAPPATALFPE